MMYGYTSADIAHRLGVVRQTVDMFFKRAVAKIVRRNNELWDDVQRKKTET